MIDCRKQDYLWASRFAPEFKMWTLLQLLLWEAVEMARHLRLHGDDCAPFRECVGLLGAWSTIFATRQVIMGLM